MSNTSKDNSYSIPLVTDVVVLGDPEMKRLAQEKQAMCDDHAAINLQRRIDDVESAIGQDESKAPSRAHAIRAEFSAI
ncbi:MAG: DUF2486 family protein [Thiotrichaceae bacterium]